MDEGSNCDRVLPPACRLGEVVDGPAPRNAGAGLSAPPGVAEGDPAFVRALAERGGWDRVQTWLADHRKTFATGLLP
ncbi:hypothetical protein [Streptomyces pseudogriseolus]|uniref:hypothetical protein n=1 Tax=Streptomyces pseudogriseolus TaxID=36817 RepID=UPI003FA21A48